MRFKYKGKEKAEKYCSRQSARHILEIGCGTGLLTKLLSQRFPTSRFTLNDLCPAMCEMAAQNMAHDTNCMTGDAEQSDFPGKYSLITSAATIQWFSDLPRFLSRIEKSLDERGMMLFSTFGSDNLKELRHTTGIGLPYFSGEMLQELFERNYTDVSVNRCQRACMRTSFDTPLLGTIPLALCHRQWRSKPHIPSCLYNRT